MSPPTATMLLLLLLPLLLLTNPALGSKKNPHRLHPHLWVSPNYSIHEAPTANVPGKPLDIFFSINLRNVLGVNEKEQIISLETTLRLFWKEPRVRVEPGAFKDPLNSGGDPEWAGVDYLALNPRVAQHFWIPDIFLDRAKLIRQPTFFVKPASLRVYRDTTIRYSSRINFDVACQMDFHRFPVDEQLCEIKFESFGHTNKQLKFIWKKNSSNINPNITLAQFDMQVSLEDTYATDYYDLSYPGIILKIFLRRELGYHVVQTYVPSMVFVTLAWLSLFISPESVPGRVGMGMTTLLTLTAMFGAVRQNVPRVSYISLLDVWMVTCIMFVFACILEFTVVTFRTRKGHKAGADRIERLSRYAVPAAFLAFNLVYWPFLFLG